MKYVARLLFAVPLVAASLAGASRLAAAAPQTIYDGLWNVEIVTLRGDCDHSLRYAVRIVEGRVLADDQRYQVDGKVAPSGAVRVVVAEAGRSANGVGRLTRDRGRGQWHTSTKECAGEWIAARRVGDN